MAKRRKACPDTHVDMTVRLPPPVFQFCTEVGKLSECSISQVITVMLAIEVLKRRGDQP